MAVKYSVTHTFEVPLEDLLKAREDRYKNLDKFPDLKNIEMLEEKKVGDILHQKRKVHLGASMPQVLATALGDPSLMEESTFDLKSLVHEFRMYPPNKENVVQIRGKSLYATLSPKESKRSYDIEIKSEVLFVSGLIEKAVEEIHRHTLEKDKASLRKFLNLD